MIAAGLAAKFAWDEAGAAWRQVEINRKEIEVIRDAAQKELRAYLYLAPHDFLAPDPDKPIEIILRVQNAGQTPAYNIFYKDEVGIFYKPQQLDEIKRFSFEETKTADPQIAFLPAEKKIRLPRQFKRNVLDDVLISKTGFVYVYGTIYYYDIYADRWWTTFCFIFTREGYFQDCHTGNDASTEPNEP